MSRAKIDGELMVHAINAAEGVLENGQEGPAPVIVMLAAQPEAEGSEEAKVHSMSTASPETQIQILEEALRMMRAKLGILAEPGGMAS